MGFELQQLIESCEVPLAPEVVQSTAFRTTKYQGLSIAEHVRQLLRSSGTADCPVDTMAQHFFISSRTFTRRLASENTSYRQVQDEIRMELAARYLDDKSIRISEVARRLGYRNASNFIKAFKRWTGETPHRFRSGAPCWALTPHK